MRDVVQLITAQARRANKCRLSLRERMFTRGAKDDFTGKFFASRSSVTANEGEVDFLDLAGDSA